MTEYSQVDLREWTVFQAVDTNLLHSVELAHVFGYGGESAYFVTSQDEVYAIGENLLGRLGIGPITTAEQPVRLGTLCGKGIKCFATGTVHTLALSDEGEVYGWGSNNFGQVGNGSTASQECPHLVKFPEQVQVQQIATADRYCLALTACNKLFHWGDILWNNESQETLPVLLKWASSEIVVRSISCGAFHAAAVTTNGKVLTWGSNEAGQLGYSQPELQTEPRLVEGQIADQVILKVTCSILATVALTEEGYLYVWGANSSSFGIDSLGDSVSCPQRVVGRRNIIDVASNNLKSFICAESEDPHQFFIWALDEEGGRGVEAVGLSSMVEGFAGRAMPVMTRKTISHPAPMHQPQLQPIQGPVRDIGQALFNKSELSDLTIKVADGEVYVHSLILKTFSEHFKTLLADNWSNGKKFIDMTQYNPHAYRAFLKFVYTGLLEPLEGTEIIALCDIAVSYFETDLKNLCIQMFRHCLNSENVVQLFTLAVGNHSELVESCIHFTSQNLDAVVLSDGFEALDPQLSKTLVLSAIKAKYHNTY